MEKNFELHNNQDKYILVINGIHYSINNVVYFILSQIKNGVPFKEIAVQIEIQFNLKASEDDIKIIIENQINPLFLKEHKKQNSSFWYNKEILKFEQYESIIKLLRFLFNPKLFWIPFLFFLITNLYWLFNISIPTNYVLNCKESILIGLLSYLSLFFLIMLHELAHASAALKFNVRAKNIGFGFYSIFPIFYADITGIWVLDKQKRIIVNLAGIYIQSILGVFLFFLYSYLNSTESNFLIQHYIFYLFISNAITLLVNLFPFFKFDGYWCYSDFFDTPNLNKNSRTLYFSIINKIVPILPFGKKQTELIYKNKALVIYAIGKGLTNVLLFFFIGNLIVKWLKSIMYLDINITHNLDWCSIKSTFFYLLFLWIISRVTFKNLKNIYSILTK